MRVILTDSGQYEVVLVSPCTRTLVCIYTYRELLVVQRRRNVNTASGATPHSGLVRTSSPDTMRPRCGAGKQSRKSGSERTSSTDGERGPGTSSTGGERGPDETAGGDVGG